MKYPVFTFRFAALTVLWMSVILGGVIWLFSGESLPSAQRLGEADSGSSQSPAYTKGAFNPRGVTEKLKKLNAESDAEKSGVGSSSEIAPETKARIAEMYERAVTEAKKLERQRTKFLWHNDRQNGNLEIFALVSEPSSEEIESVGGLIQEHLSMDSASELVNRELLNLRAELFRQFTEFREPYKFVSLIRDAQGRIEVGETFVHAPDAVKRLENGAWRLSFPNGEKNQRRSNSPFKGVKRYDYLLEFPGEAEQQTKAN